MMAAILRILLLCLPRGKYLHVMSSAVICFGLIFFLPNFLEFINSATRNSTIPRPAALVLAACVDVTDNVVMVFSSSSLF